MLSTPHPLALSHLSVSLPPFLTLVSLSLTLPSFSHSHLSLLPFPLSNPALFLSQGTPVFKQTFNRITYTSITYNVCLLLPATAYLFYTPAFSLYPLISFFLLKM